MKERLTWLILSIQVLHLAISQGLQFDLYNVGHINIPFNLMPFVSSLEQENEVQNSGKLIVESPYMGYESQCGMDGEQMFGKYAGAGGSPRVLASPTT